MRILVLSHRMPYPPNKGEKIRSYNIVRYLAARHEVYVGSLIDDAADLKQIEAFRPQVKGFLFGRIDGRSRAVSALRSLPRSRPITVTHFHSDDLQRQVDELLESQRFDAIFCFSSPMAEYVFRSRAQARIAGAVKVMDLIDVDSYKWQQYAAVSRPWTAWIYRYEAHHLAAYERRIAASFDRLLVVSEQESGYFPGKLPPGRLGAMSNGVDLTFFSPLHSGRATATGPALVFTGVMDYWPNVEGVKWFVERIWPRIQASVRDAQLYIVGSRPAPDVRRLGSVAGVTVTGFVEDVRDYVGVATVCVVPLRIARGIQNKVLEAMAMGKAVISTPQAFEGIHAEAGRDIVVADGEEAFAAAAVELLRNPARAADIGQNARRCVEKFYSWDENLRQLDGILSTTGAEEAVRARAAV